MDTDAKQRKVDSNIQTTIPAKEKRERKRNVNMKTTLGTLSINYTINQSGQKFT